MAQHEDSFLRPQMPEASSGRPRRKSELTLLDLSLGRRKSGQSAAASSTHSHENRPTQRHTSCVSDNCSGLSSPRAPSVENTTLSASRASRPAARTVPGKRFQAPLDRFIMPPSDLHSMGTIHGRGQRSQHDLASLTIRTW